MSQATATQTLASVCPLDCPDTCSLSVSVEDQRIVKVRGSKANPYTAGVICNKVARYYPDFVHGEARLRHPLKRTGARGSGEYARISWDEALDEVHHHFQKAIAEYGPQTILPFNYAGPHGELAGGSMDRRFFHQLGATQLNRGPLCGGVRGSAYASLYGNVSGMPPEQASHADTIVVWGNNVSVSNLHFMRVLKKAREQHDAKLIVIDPKRIKVAERADLYLQIRPGTDVVLAMALATELERRGALDHQFIAEWTHGFEAYMQAARGYTPEQVVEICGLPREQFEAFADYYCQADKVAVSVGNGMERGRSGGSGIRAAMALQALTGQHGRLGSGVFAKPGLAVPKTTARLQRPDLAPADTRVLNIVDLGQLLQDPTLDPPIMATLIYNHNPVCTHPDQANLLRALQREDLFIAGSDVVMTDSMKMADVILPAASHFEFDDVYGAYGQNYLQRAEAVIPCVGESLPNTEIFRRLAARFGFDDPLFKASDAQLMDEALDAEDARLEGLSGGQLPTDRALKMSAPDGQEAILCANLKPATPSGKIELYSEDLQQRFGFGLPRYEAVERSRPLALITPSSDKRTNATFGAHLDSQGLEVVEIHPQDAETYGIESGQPVRVSNDLASVDFRALVTDKVKAGVLYSPKGTWRHSSATGYTANALIPVDLRTDIEQGACYNETFVEIRAL